MNYLKLYFLKKKLQFKNTENLHFQIVGKNMIFFENAKF
jgi:hypothetical protein